MVARITFPKSVSSALNYNVQKEQQGKAICIGGNGSIVHPAMLNFYQKLALIENRNSLNDRATTKTLHVSLNFSPGETFSQGKLSAIADDYMNQLGFAEQPYLVFKHEDAGHPHIHILASCIMADGKRINTHNIGRNQSEYARRFVEKKHELVKAENQKIEKNMGILPFRYEKLEYGASETRRGIAAIVHGVMGTFNFTSLPEYNAILKQFNILADRGTEESFTWRKNGLVYRVLDTQGEKVGVPIKASALPGFPGLKNLSAQYEMNQKNREPFREKLRASLEKALQEKPKDFTSLSAILKEQNIKVVLRQNATGKIYGITFVDLENRSVFNGSEIGREYSVSGLEKQMGNKPVSGRKRRKKKWIVENKIKESKGLVEFNGFSMISEIIKPLEESNIAPYHFTKKKKKIKRR